MVNHKSYLNKLLEHSITKRVRARLAIPWRTNLATKFRSQLPPDASQNSTASQPATCQSNSPRSRPSRPISVLPISHRDSCPSLDLLYKYKKIIAFTIRSPISKTIIFSTYIL
ncbi:hypothetical protein OIU79_018591 [Salix purpurea]|uniref:Uncharacterized protein n=1 Tax=Salix purpurea TaxID=77065 RepID=A0A9Q1AL79_SALPP|nr:hypothetical protein OIU79_018591 [Salix purpurea]